MFARPITYKQLRSGVIMKGGGAASYVILGLLLLLLCDLKHRFAIPGSIVLPHPCGNPRVFNNRLSPSR